MMYLTLEMVQISNLVYTPYQGDYRHFYASKLKLQFVHLIFV